MISHGMTGKSSVKIVSNCTHYEEYCSGEDIPIRGVWLMPKLTHKTISVSLTFSLRFAHDRTPVPPLDWLVYLPPAYSSPSLYLVT